MSCVTNIIKRIQDRIKTYFRQKSILYDKIRANHPDCNEGLSNCGILSAKKTPEARNSNRKYAL